jgi:hypothetical protein
MECPIAVANPEIGAPPIQNRVQLLDHHADLPIRRKRPHRIADPLTDIAARLFARPHQQHPPRSFPKLEAEKRETVCQRCQSTLLLVHHQMKSRKLSPQLLRVLSVRLRSAVGGLFQAEVCGLGNRRKEARRGAVAGSEAVALRHPACPPLKFATEPVDETYVKVSGHWAPDDEKGSGAAALQPTNRIFCLL